MSLRKSPTRTPAFLAANRANAQLVMGTVLKVWAVKLGLMRWAACQEREEWFAQSGGVCPAPLRLLIKRPGWKVRVSVYLRWGRGRGGQWWEPGPGWKERRARLHVVVTDTASIGHPLLGCSRLEEVPRGIAPRVVFGTKPECARKQTSSQNVITIKDSPHQIGREWPVASGEWQGKSSRGTKKFGISSTGALRPVRRANAARPVPPSPAQRGLRSGVTGSREKPAPPSDQGDPISSYIASSQRDVLFWLRPENAVLTGPRLSEFESIESWLDAFVTQWEKQHGPIPKKEVMPHEIAVGGSCLGTRPEQNRKV